MNTAAVRANRRKLLILAAIVLLCAAGYMLVNVNFSNPKLLAYAMKIRTPKLIVMLITAFAIGGASIVFQSIINNTIVTPCLLGMNSLYTLIHTAVVFFLGSASVVASNANLSFAVDVVLMGIAATVIYSWIFKKTKHNVLYVLLVGTVLTSFFGSIQTTLTRVMDPNEYDSLLNTLVASFSNINSEIIVFSLILLASVIFALRRELALLDVLTLGKEQAINLGVDYDRCIRRLLLGVTLCIAVATAMVGPISFLGLIIANLSRQLLKTFRHTQLVLGSALFGMIVLVGGQLIVEHVYSYSVPVSVFITVGGGLVSVAYSDAISALLMIGGFFLAIPFLIGVANSQGATLPPEKMTITGGMSGWELLGYFLPSLALMLGDQNMLQRFASAKNSDEAKKSNIGMFIGEILVIISIVLIVTQAAKLYPTLETPSNVIFQVAVDYLPLVFGALVMCACMAFIVTTADSYLLSSATNLTNDIYVKYIRKDATDKQKMLVLRGTIIVFSFIAVALTLYFPTVLSLQMTAYTMYGAAITPAILFALFSKKVTPAGGMAGILVGGLVTIIWTLMGTPYGIQCAIVAVPASVIAILIVSAVTRCNDPKRSLEALYQDN